LSLTLNQTPGNDNEAIFLLKIAAEGNNIISNSGFADNTDWSEGGNWVIGSGVATYTYADTASENLNQTVEAAAAVEYVLEYTVTAKAEGDGFGFYLRGGASLFAALTIELDQTIGKHTMVFTGNATETVFGLGVSGMSAGDSISIDNVKVRKKEDPIYLSTRDISLSPLTFDGKVISWNVLGDVTQYVDVETSGGIGSVTGYSFSIARHTLNTRTSSFFNEFFPAYDGGVIIARDVQLGIVWNTGSPDATDITWLYRGRVIDYAMQPRQLDLVILQTTEFDARELPYYSIQKDSDNGVSYFTNAPDENYGYSLPIVYGDFSTYRDDQSLFKPKLFPLIAVDKTLLRYIAASHFLDLNDLSSGGSSIMWKYVDGLDTYMRMTCVNGSSINSLIRAYVTHYDTLISSDNVVIGVINIHPELPGSRNDKTDFFDAVDDDNTTTVVSTYDGGYDELAVKIKGGGSPPGVLSREAGSVNLNAYITDATLPGTLQIGMLYHNPEYDSGTGGDGTGDTKTWASGVELETYDLSADFAGRDASGEPWRWDELMGLEYIIRAQSGDAITVRDLWLQITNIIVNDFRPIRRTGTGARTGRNNTGGRNY